MNTLLIADAYKLHHRDQYPANTELVYSNWTPRSNGHALVKTGVVVFGIQAFFMKLNEWFTNDFFNVPIADVEAQFIDEYEQFFGVVPKTAHLLALHKLGYLPIEVRALQEGSVCPIGVPMLTMWNTNPEFYWITNFLETIMSTELWQPMTSATIAKGYKDLLMAWSTQTCDNHAHIPFQAHDFSMRGMGGFESAMASGAGHLTSFVGTDTIPAVAYVNKYYSGGNRLIGTSIPATEHSVMSMGTKDDELGTFRRLITEIYPHGFISIVSDTWDLWKVLTEYIPALKEEILARDGRVVVRPDSGDPVDIICGKKVISWDDAWVKWKASYDSDTNYDDFYIKKDGKTYAFYIKCYPDGMLWDILLKEEVSEPNIKGVIELLWDTFGGTINEKGYKVLDTHIGAIYGDSITIARAEEICSRLESKGFASSNIVFGVGSFTYQYNTRDTYGFAMKATYGEVAGVGREIFKDPITDDGLKKSLKGLIKVINTDAGIKALDQQSDINDSGELIPIYKNGNFVVKYSFKDIRDLLEKS